VKNCVVLQLGFEADVAHSLSIEINETLHVKADRYDIFPLTSAVSNSSKFADVEVSLSFRSTKHHTAHHNSSTHFRHREVIVQHSIDTIIYVTCTRNQ
jgi:hypothetical protein